MADDIRPRNLYRVARAAYGVFCDVVSAGMAANPALAEAVLHTIESLGSSRRSIALRHRLRRGTVERVAEQSALRWTRIGAHAQLLVDIRKVVGCLYFGELYEPVTTQRLLRCLHPGDVFVDIGANVGYFTVLAAATVGASGRVIAVEANPVLAQRLRTSLTRNAFAMARVFDVAATDHDGDLTFYLSNDVANDGIASTTPWEGHLATGDLSESNTIRVRGRRFDSLEIQPKLPRIDVLKIDVEGAELAVLHGMAETFERTPPRQIVCETTLEGDVTEWLRARGYRAEPLEYLKPELQWGNIIYSR